jgi:hypothetical protein
MHMLEGSSRVIRPARVWLQAKCVYHFKAAMGLLQQHAVCNAQYDFVSQWDYRRGAECGVVSCGRILPTLGALTTSVFNMDGTDALADRRQESVAEAPISFGEPASAQQRVPTSRGSWGLLLRSVLERSDFSL